MAALKPHFGDTPTMLSTHLTSIIDLCRLFDPPQPYTLRIYSLDFSLQLLPSAMYILILGHYPQSEPHAMLAGAMLGRTILRMASMHT